MYRRQEYVCSSVAHLAERMPRGHNRMCRFFTKVNYEICRNAFRNKSCLFPPALEFCFVVSLVVDCGAAAAVMKRFECDGSWNCGNYEIG